MAVTDISLDSDKHTFPVYLLGVTVPRGSSRILLAVTDFTTVPDVAWSPFHHDVFVNHRNILQISLFAHHVKTIATDYEHVFGAPLFPPTEASTSSADPTNSFYPVVSQFCLVVVTVSLAQTSRDSVLLLLVGARVVPAVDPSDPTLGPLSAGIAQLDSSVLANGKDKLVKLILQEWVDDLEISDPPSIKSEEDENASQPTQPTQTALTQIAQLTQIRPVENNFDRDRRPNELRNSQSQPRQVVVKSEADSDTLFLSDEYLTQIGPAVPASPVYSPASPGSPTGSPDTLAENRPLRSIYSAADLALSRSPTRTHRVRAYVVGILPSELAHVCAKGYRYDWLQKYTVADPRLAPLELVLADSLDSTLTDHIAPVLVYVSADDLLEFFGADSVESLYTRIADHARKLAGRPLKQVDLRVLKQKLSGRTVWTARGLTMNKLT